MMCFHEVMMSFGEHGVQAILEDWERHNRIFHARPLSLEARWVAFIRATDEAPMMAAA